MREQRSALAASIHLRLSLIVRFTEGIAAAERHARAAVDLAERLEDDAAPCCGHGSARAHPLQRGQAWRPPARRGGARARTGSGLSARGRRRLLARAHPRLVATAWSGRGPCWRASTGSGASLTNAWPRMRSGISRSSSFARATSRWRASYAERAQSLSGQYARADSESPTSLCRWRSLPLTAATSCSPASSPSALAGWPRCTERSSAPLTRRSASSSSGAETRRRRLRASQRRSGSRRPAAPTASIRACAGGGRIRSRRCSSSAWSTKPVSRLDAWEADGRRLRRDWVLAHATRCRGLVAAARGDVDGAVSLLADAVDAARGGRRPVRSSARATRPRRRSPAGAAEAGGPRGDRGGARRLRGDRERHAGRRRRVRSSGQIGGRTRIEGLTPAERRVAALVATGRTNAEVAASLFLAERTVASHLTRVYSKLGVRSRTELSRRLG